nr:NAD(P)H-binding protein [candidate division Zixibacteria bacterium]
MINKILIIGGTGLLGQPVTWRFKYDGYQVRLLSHSPERARRIFGDQVEIVEGDVTQPDGLAEAIRGCDAVYINLGAKMNIPDYERVEHRGTINIVQAAAGSDIERIGMISELNVGTTDIDNHYFRAKRGAEKAVTESGFPYTIFRCCHFFDSLPLYVVDKRAMMFGRQPHKRSWISSSDYALMVSKAFSMDEAKNKIFHVRGIDRLTVREALEKYLGITGAEVKITETPLWLLGLLSRFSKNKSMRGLAEFMKAFDRIPEAETEDDTEEILGPALTTIGDWAREYTLKK